VETSRARRLRLRRPPGPAVTRSHAYPVRRPGPVGTVDPGCRHPPSRSIRTGSHPP